jgi:hypothetical protein
MQDKWKSGNGGTAVGRLDLESRFSLDSLLPFASWVTFGKSLNFTENKSN